MPELIAYKDVEIYLQNKQVYFKKEIADVNLQTIAAAQTVHYVGAVVLERISEERIAFTIIVNGIKTTMYEYKSDNELFKWVKENFIPVAELAQAYRILYSVG